MTPKSSQRSKIRSKQVLELKMDTHLKELRQSFRNGRTRSLEWRKEQLISLIHFIQDKENAIFEALFQDLGKHPVEIYRDEVGIVLKSATNALSCLHKWIAPKKKYVPLLFFPAKGEVLPEPYGLVLIISSWNFPLSLALDPLIGAISAGNTAVLKPSEYAPACSSLLAATLPLYLDDKAIKVVEGGADISEQLLQQKWDKIFFTGSPSVAKIVMSEAAKHLTPVTLELGGKCPAIFDYSSVLSNMKVAAKRIVGGKWGPCSGQACIGIDYLLVEDKFASELIESLKRVLKKFYGENSRNSTSIARIVNEKHVERISNMLNDPKVAGCIVHGGLIDKQKCFIEPTILLNPPIDADIMTEEIFGPVLPIITLDRIEESIEFINARPKPLAIYAFTEDETLKKRIISETSSGSVTFNDTMVQFVCDSLPFGGVGQSGFGSYHGKYSFDAFSHDKAVLQRSFLIELEPRYPPWNDFKLKFIRLAYRFDYFRLVLLLLGLKK
ncbi:aldehyde dehydrogenase family 3 member F1 [Cucurbita pepo subsp. pepo]|uniref:aldehyde dehydrogenase family 3 member F1 n=1 Tax=Cucurbita pepo subsp. pepo TaxID=3664 RepID=UPI000C9D8BA8|nr:aldehyde dehydrogenase family 3 member F1 [Cucurbita pepo subsp. pepo]